MKEIVFLVEVDLDGGYTARAAGAPIFTQGRTLDELRRNIGEAIDCHFDEPQNRPRIIRLVSRK